MDSTTATQTADPAVALAALTGFSRAAVERLSAAKAEPDWVLAARLAAWDTYESLPMPTTTVEEWRRTALRGLKLDNQVPFAPETERIASLDDLRVTSRETALAIGGERAGMTVQRDASTVYTEAAASFAARGVIFTDLDTAIRDHADLIQKHFMTTAVPAGLGKFQALHGAMWQGGTFLYVPAGVSVGVPFQSFVLGETPGTATFNHSLVVLEEGAEAFFVDAYHSETAGKQSYASETIELILAKDAKLRYVQVQDWGRHTVNMATQRATLAADAELKSLQVTIGSKWSKNSIGAHLQGRNAVAEMLGIFFADGDQFFDHHTYQLHESGYATSDLEFKGALKDTARSVYSGLIRVSEGAQKTDAFQANRNLILSRGARADTIPNLEIAANDVRCTHGATVSQVEEEHIFYLQARGIPRSEAQKLIVEGFFRPVIDRIPVEEIQDFLKAAIGRKVGI
ncbi:MAG: Fe-S cluster assembly protein SufD [Thermomicrobiales bacterium]